MKIRHEKLTGLFIAHFVYLCTSKHKKSTKSGFWLRIILLFGAWGSVVVKALRDRFPVVSLGIFSVVASDKTMCTGVDSASENEYQVFLLG